MSASAPVTLLPFLVFLATYALAVSWHVLRDWRPPSSLDQKE
jgi:hypothetical protein